MGTDWSVFYHAIWVLWHGGNPYADIYFMSPSWLLWLLSPLVLFSERVSYWVWVVISIIIYACVFRRLGISPLGVLLFLTSPPVIGSLWYGNVEALAILGFILPAPVGLVLMTVKPQLMIGAILYRLFQNWKSGLPLLVLIVLSIWIYGAWWENGAQVVNRLWNYAGFPIYLPLGVVLLYRAIMQKDERGSLAASLCLSPYFSFSALMCWPLAFSEKQREYYFMIAGAWLVFLILMM